MVVIKSVNSRLLPPERRHHYNVAVYKSKMGTVRPGPVRQRCEPPRQRPRNEPAPYNGKNAPPGTGRYQGGGYQGGGHPGGGHPRGGGGCGAGPVMPPKGQCQRRPPVNPAACSTSNTWSTTTGGKKPTVPLRSMWFINVSILASRDEETQDDEYSEDTVLFETQLIVNYEKMDQDLNIKVNRLLQDMAPEYRGGFYIEPDGRQFERAVKKTKDHMFKSRNLSNPLHYSPPALPVVTIRLCEPLPIVDDEPEEEEEVVEEDNGTW